MMVERAEQTDKPDYGRWDRALQAASNCEWVDCDCCNELPRRGPARVELNTPAGSECQNQF